MNTFKILSWLFSTILVISACSTAPHRATRIECPESGPDCFGQPSDASSGLARLYVFRADLSDEYTRDVPSFGISGFGSMRLAWQTYASFDLPLGKHQFAVSPQRGESKIWQMQGTITVSAPGRYYMAIWNSAIPPPEYSNPVAAALGVQNPLLGVVATIIGAPRGDGRYARYEVISEAEALESIRRCRLSPPIQSP